MSQGTVMTPHIALTPGFSQAEINAPIRLYDGPVELEQGAHRHSGQVQIDLRWFPFPEVAFHMDVPPGIFQLGSCQISFLTRGVAVDAKVIGIKLDTTAGSSVSSVKIFLERGAAFKTDMLARKASFEIVNFVRYHGQWIGGVGASHNNRSGRVILSGGGWRTTLDSVENIQQVDDALKAEGGYGLTHTGSVERDDGTEYTWQSFVDFQWALLGFLSFVRGSWVGVIVPKAQTNSGSDSFSSWQLPKLSIWKSNDTWFSPLHSQEMVTLFPGFMNRWNDSRWRDVTAYAVDAYVESNSQSVSMESSILLGQITLELLAAAVLVEERSIVSPADFYNSRMWPAAKKFTELLNLIQVPVAIPPCLTHLTAAASGQNWSDGPTALTQTRNKIAHSTLPNLRRLSAITSDLKFEIRQLTLWYVELALLSWFGYSGGYRNRLDPPFHHIENQVPWTPPPPIPTA